jgi:hypothetical protein
MSSSLEGLYSLQLEIRELIHDQLKLATLEMRLAVQNFVVLVAIAVCIGALLLMAWAGLMATVAFGLVYLGLDSTIALLSVTTLTLGLALLLGMHMRHRSSRMGLPATLRALKPPITAPHAGEGA